MYWSWNGGPREGRGALALEQGGQISGGGGAGGGWDSIFENDQSSKVLDVDTQMKLFQYSTQITGAEWPQLKQITSPCPTLKVIGAVTQAMVKREELKRMRELGRPGMSEYAPVEKVEVPKPKKAVVVADRVVSGVLSNTVGRVARFAGRRILGEIPDTAKTGSFHEKDVKKQAQAIAVAAEVDGKELIEEAISAAIKKDNIQMDTEDEALFKELYENDAPIKAENRTVINA